MPTLPQEEFQARADIPWLPWEDKNAREWWHSRHWNQKSGLTYCIRRRRATVQLTCWWEGGAAEGEGAGRSWTVYTPSPLGVSVEEYDNWDTTLMKDDDSTTSHEKKKAKTSGRILRWRMFYTTKKAVAPSGCRDGSGLVASLLEDEMLWRSLNCVARISGG